MSSASIASGSHDADALFITSWYQTSRPSVIVTGLSRPPPRFSTTTCSMLGVPVSASSAIAFSGTIPPRRYPPSAVMSTLAWASLIRSRSDSELKPPKTTLWMAPIRAQASMATGSSGTIGM